MKGRIPYAGQGACCDTLHHWFVRSFSSQPAPAFRFAPVPTALPARRTRDAGAAPPADQRWTRTSSNAGRYDMGRVHRWAASALAWRRSGGGFRWGWVVLGAGLGAALVTSFIWLTMTGPPRAEVILLVGALTLVLNGAILAGLSPGNTIREAALAGAILTLLAGAAVILVLDLEVPRGWAVAGLLLGPALAALGGWVGEVMQGTLVSGAVEGEVQWAWVGAGTVLGVLLSYYALFVGHALLPGGLVAVLSAFVISFGVMGFFVGYLSPGYTLLEPALAGIAVIGVDALLAVVGFHAPFPLGTLVVAAVVGFLMGMIGGWAGETVRGRPHDHLAA